MAAGGARQPATDAGDIRWPYWPRSMRVHPLTRIVTAEGSEPVIEARVEMRDRDGHLTKGRGRLRLDLHDASDETPGGTIAEWNLDLRDLDFNRERFDDVTFTYLFRLDVDPDQIPPAPVLWAYYLSDDAEELSARFEIMINDAP